MITPLRCITNLTNGLEVRLAHVIEDQPQVGKELGLVQKTTQLLLNQVKGYLDRDLLTQNMFLPKLEPYSLNDLVDEVCGMLQPEAEVLGMQFIFYSLKRDLKVVIDKTRTQQILINLVQNAIKYSHKSGTIWIGVETHLIPNRGCIGVIFRVRDKGKGIAANKRS